ncbi:MAG: DUF952 domain-containing protein [Hyphomicrobiales bacterium]
MATIYKICNSAQWEEARTRGQFTGAAVDIEDGFIHFSTSSQVAKTAAKHFAGREGLVLLSVDAGQLGEELRWEPSRGGDLFPHLYAPLPVSAVTEVHELPWVDGAHLFPEALGE